MRKKTNIVKNIYRCICACLLVFCMAGCGSVKQPSFSALERMKEMTIDGNKVTIVLYQDGALPSRWEITGLGEGVELLEDYQVEEPDAFPFDMGSVGSAPEYQVYVMELTAEDKCWIQIDKNRINTDPKELLERKSYLLEKDGETWKQSGM